jgi:acyl-CoA synthetase (AMP-forming)/AMP-acid ligase II/carbon monoxide dehydrogenase subunit G
MRIEVSQHVDAPLDAVWSLLGDPANYRRLVPGMARIEPLRGPSGDDTDDAEPMPGLGRQYAYRLQLGATTFGGQLELVEYVDHHEIAWASVTGIDHRLRIRLRADGDARTRVDVRLAYHAAGGLAGLVTDQVAALGARRRIAQTMTAIAAELAGTPVEKQPGGEHLAARAGTALKAASVLLRSGIVAPSRPDRSVRQLRELTRWGPTPAGGFAASVARFPDAAAVIDDDGTTTFRGLDERSSRLAGGLAAHGCVSGSRVALLCRNQLDLVTSILACVKLGADALLLNTGMSPGQTREVLDEQQPEAVIYDEEFAGMLRGAPRSVRRITAYSQRAVRGLSVDKLVAEGSPGALPVPEKAGRTIVLTSGTTGTPKGAQRPNPSGLGTAAALLSRIPLRAGEPTFVAAPMFHTWGFANVQIATALGSTLVLSRRFDPEATLAAIAEHRCTALVAVPVMIQRIMDLPDDVRRRHDTSSLRIVALSGSALPGTLATRFMAEFGPVLYNLYGSTEVSWATIATPTDLRAAPGTSGRPPRGTRIAIVGEGHGSDGVGKELGTGEVGRIFVGNELLFEGYTSGVDKDRWHGLMATGDVGYRDASGLLFVSGRDDDMIVSGGENVFPREVEDLLAARGEVREAAVVGVEDEKFGQRLAAYVVLRDGTTLDAEGVRDLVRDKLARFSVPRDVVFLDALPRNATGKVLTRELPPGAMPDESVRG